MRELQARLMIKIEILTGMDYFGYSTIICKQSVNPEKDNMLERTPVHR